MDMQGQNTQPKETTKHSQSEEKANQHNEAKKKRILSPVLKLIGLGTEATATAFFAMLLPFLLPALLGLGVLGGLSVAIKALWPKSVQPEMAISQIREIKEFKVLKLCLEDVVTQNYQDREFQFVARGDAVYGVEFDKITCTVKEENKEKILIVEVPYPKLLNSRINYDNEERQGKGIENWKYDNKNLPDKVALKLTNERGSGYSKSGTESGFSDARKKTDNGTSQKFVQRSKAESYFPMAKGKYGFETLQRA